MIRLRTILAALAGLASIAAAAPAHAALAAVAPSGFTSQITVTTKADPVRAWRAFFKPQDWWSGSHTYSGDARNLRMEARAGGCFCERLPRDGAVKHGEVVLLIPDRTVRLSAPLGPLQEMAASAAWTVQVAGAEGGGATITWTFVVAGADAENWATLSKAVDSVMQEQAQRYAAYVDQPGK